MRAISIQIQPNRSSGMDMNSVTVAFEEIAAMTDLVEHHSFDSGVDNGPYFNFTFGTSHARRLWSVIKERVYADPEIGDHMRRASMAMCSSETGWDSYDLLFHFDSTVPVEDLT